MHDLMDRAADEEEVQPIRIKPCWHPGVAGVRMTCAPQDGRHDRGRCPLLRSMPPSPWRLVTTSPAACQNVLQRHRVLNLMTHVDPGSALIWITPANDVADPLTFRMPGGRVDRAHHRPLTPISGRVDRRRPTSGWSKTGPTRVASIPSRVALSAC